MKKWKHEGIMCKNCDKQIIVRNIAENAVNDPRQVGRLETMASRQPLTTPSEPKKEK